MGDHHLGRLSTRAVAGRVRPMLIVPLGATEQHGPHLPVDTDTMVAAAWADRVATMLAAGAAVVAPVLPYGSSGEHQDFPGTLSIGRAALELVVVELGRSARNDFGALVLLSGHAGNLEPLRAAVGVLRSEGQVVHHFVPTWPEAAFGPIDAHAGRVETSLMLHLAPDRVDLGAARKGATEPLSALLPNMRQRGVRAVSESGVLGDPTGASAAEGARLLDDLARRTVAALIDQTGAGDHRDDGRSPDSEHDSVDGSPDVSAVVSEADTDDRTE